MMSEMSIRKLFATVLSRGYSSELIFITLPLFQEGQLSVTGESMYTKYWLTA